MKVILNGQASHQHLLYEKGRLEQTIADKISYLDKAKASALWIDEDGIKSAEWVLQDCKDRIILLDHLIAMGSSCNVELDL